MTTELKNAVIINVTEGFIASPFLMTPNRAAREIDRFKEMFRTQGYYMTRDGMKLSPEWAEYRIEMVDEKDSFAQNR